MALFILLLQSREMDHRMKIYLAARYSRYPEMQQYAEQLQALGHTVTSRWIAGNHQISDAGLSEEGSQAERVRFAEEDFFDLVQADAVISFTEEPRSLNSSRGGRHVEFGMAIAFEKWCAVVGWRENIFHCMEEVNFYPTWEECLKQFQGDLQ